MLRPVLGCPRPYHREIGREATASGLVDEFGKPPYHREIGREATACTTKATQRLEPYHREIGREATANNTFVLFLIPYATISGTAIRST